MTAQTLIWIDKGRAADNAKLKRNDPAIVVHTESGRFRCSEVKGDGWRLVQDCNGGPAMGATVWLEVDPGRAEFGGRAPE